ncbi:MAG TPA: DUF4190 domain-containing protein [Mycobacteriales bacterium]|nr:DUF4190 domain-containing protein [Mycobacteriales bacterium]
MHTDPLVADYLGRLDVAAAGLPPDRRAELLAEIRGHIDDALREAGRTDEATVRNVLDRLGPPEEIAAEAAEGAASPAPVAAPGGPAGPPPRETNGLAIASLLLGLLWFFWIGSVLAIPLGYWAKRQIRRSSGAQQGAGLATAGIVLGWVGMAMLLITLLGALGFTSGSVSGDGDPVPSQSLRDLAATAVAFSTL